MSAGFLIQTDTGAPQVEMPIGEGFPKTGFIAPWVARVMYKVAWYELDLQKEMEDIGALLPSNAKGLLEELTAGGQAPFDARVTSRSGDKFAYYYNDKDRANLLQDYCHLHEPKEFKPTPNMVWYFETSVDDIFGLDDEAKEKFSGPVISFDVRITTLRSKKYRHAYHFLTLPAFVSAYAQAAGIECPVFDISPLTAPEDEVIFNLDTERYWIGDSDAGYDEAYFWKERVKVWESLGEADAQNYVTKESKSKYSVESDKLDTLLQATVRPWTTPVNARLIPVPDPRVGAAYTRGDDKVRPSIPVITEIFANADEARKVAEAERASRTEAATEARAEAMPALPSEPVVATDAPDELAVPTAWASAKDAWVTQVKDIKNKLVGPPPTWAGQIAGVIAGLGYDLGASEEEVVAWLNHV